jgi:hypothetical protein
MGYALRSEGVAPRTEVKRRKVLLSGLVQSGADHFPVRVREVWRNGAMVQSSVVPEVGSLVLLTRGMLIVAAQVTAADETSFEMAFREAVDEAALLGTGMSGAPAPRLSDDPFDPFLDDEADDDNMLPISKH